jgi:MFS family permease
MNTFVLKNRDYLLLFLGGAVSSLGTSIYNFAISLYIYVLTDGNAALAGIYLATGGLVYFGFSPFAGAIVDRLDKVKVVYVTDFINGSIVGIAGLLLFLGMDPFHKLILLFIVTIILGINGALFGPAASGLPPHILEQDQLQQAASLSQGGQALYGIVGAALGGLLYNFLPIQYIFIINGLSFILSSFSEMFIQTKTMEDKQNITIKVVLKDMVEGVKYLYTLKPILWLVIVASLLNFFTVPVIVNGLPYLFEVLLNQKAYYLSILMAMFPTGIIISSIFLASIRQKEKVHKYIVIGLYGMAIAFVFVLIATKLLLDDITSFKIFMFVSVSGLLVAGMFNAFINIPFRVSIFKFVNKDKLGRVSSSIGFISNGLTPIAIAIGGFVIEHFGLMIIYVLASVAMFLTAIFSQTNKYIKEL